MSILVLACIVLLVIAFGGGLVPAYRTSRYYAPGTGLVGIVLIALVIAWIFGVR